MKKNSLFLVKTVFSTLQFNSNNSSLHFRTSYLRQFVESRNEQIFWVIRPISHSITKWRFSIILCVLYISFQNDKIMNYIETFNWTVIDEITFPALYFTGRLSQPLLYYFWANLGDFLLFFNLRKTIGFILILFRLKNGIT